MELEEMKTVWKELDGRLDRQEMFSANFIRESIATRSQRSANKFLTNEMVGAGLILVAVPLAVWRYGTPSAGSVSGLKPILLILLVLLPLLFLWQLIKIFPLFKLDMSRDVKDNIVRVKKYEIYAQCEKWVVIVLTPLLFLAVSVWRAVAMNDAPWLWVAWVAIIILGALCYVWYYKKFYANNMGAIKRGLEELKDL